MCFIICGIQMSSDFRLPPVLSMTAVCSSLLALLLFLEYTKLFSI